MNSKITELEKKIKKKQDEARYEHTLGVMYTAASLAMKHEVDLEQALIAGLLHDCAKCYPDEKKFELCKKYNVKLTKFEKENTSLIHAKLGSVMAKEKYGIDDEEILHSILTHTTGAPDMNALDKIIFIADYIEPGRDKANRLSEIRKTAFESLDKALIMILEDTLGYLKKSNKLIDTMTEQTYNYYIKSKENKDE